MGERGVARGRRALLGVLGGGLLGTLAGCKSATIGQMQDAPIENRLFLHAGYKAGDYGLYEAMDGAMHVLIKIVDVQPDAVEVELSWPKAPIYVEFMTRLRRRMFLDGRGVVRSAYVEDLASGRRHPLRVAAPGEPNHIGEISAVDFGAGAPLTTRAGTFTIRKIILFTLSLDNGLIRQDVTTSIFVDPDAPFGLVRRVDAYAPRVPILDLYKQAASYAPLPQAAMLLNNYLLSRLGEVKPWEMSLLERG